MLRFRALAEQSAAIGIIQEREARVVELQIGTTELAEACNLRRIDFCEIVEVLVDIGIDRAIDSTARRVVHHAGRRDRLLRRRSGRRFQELEIIGEDDFVEPNLLANPISDELEIRRAAVGHERDLHHLIKLFDAADRVLEVHEPVDAPVLAVGDTLQTDVLLHLHGVADRPVFQLAQLRRGNAAGLAIRASLQQLLRPQQTTDVIGTKRRLRSRTHRTFPL